MYSLTQKLLAEFFGTFAVVFFAAGALCADQYLRASGQGSITILGLALAYGLTVGIMVIRDRTHLRRPPQSRRHRRFLGQPPPQHHANSPLLGRATISAPSPPPTLLAVIIPDSSWRPEALGSITPALAPDFTRLHGMLLEGVMTFFLVFVFFATSVDAKGAFNKVAGFAIGLAVTVDALCGLPFTGAAVNPARAFGPALVTRNHWTNHGVYWVGPLLGGVLAGVLYDRIFLPTSPDLVHAIPGSSLLYLLSHSPPPVPKFRLSISHHPRPLFVATSTFHASLARRSSEPRTINGHQY